MTSAAEEIIRNITSIPAIAGFIVIVLAVIALANFTEALENIHGFFRRAFGEKVVPEPAWGPEFEALRRNVIYCGLANDLPVHLGKLRKFFIDTGLIERPEVGDFAQRWLSHPVLSLGMPVLNVFSAEEEVNLKKELVAMQL